MTTKTKPHTFKVGDRVVCRKAPDVREEGPGFVGSMERYVGKIGRVSKTHGEGVSGEVQVSHNGDRWWYLPNWLSPARPLTKSERHKRRREQAKDRALAKAAALAAAEVERKKKTARAKALRKLSPAGKRAVAALETDASALGCQRAFVVRLVAALTGDDIAAVIQ